LYTFIVLSDGFSEGKLRDLRSPFPPDQPTELDGHDFIDDSDLEDIEDDTKLTINVPDTPEHRKSPLKSPVFGSGFSSPFSPQITRPGNISGTATICAIGSMDPGTRLGKVVVLRDISFVTWVPTVLRSKNNVYWRFRPSLRAVLFFLYTGEITFTSQSPSAKRPCKLANAKEFCASAKSIYLAADKVQNPSSSSSLIDDLPLVRHPRVERVCIEMDPIHNPLPRHHARVNVGLHGNVQIPLFSPIPRLTE
jgi:hypothetical protein